MMKKLAIGALSTLLFAAPVLADLSHEEVRTGAKVILASDAKMRFKCKSGFECEDHVKQFALGTITGIEGFKAYITLKESKQVIVGNYNESGLMGADLETPELLEQRAAHLEQEKAKEKARKEAIKKLAPKIKMIRETTKWTFEGVALGTELADAKKALRAKKFQIADLGDDIWAVNGYEIEKQPVQVHLWFNELGLLYRVEVLGEGRTTQHFQKTAVGQMNQFRDVLGAVFGTPSETKKIDIYAIEPGAEDATPFFRWQMVDVEGMVGCQMSENMYLPVMMVTATQLVDVSGDAE
ncbi:MAG: hypothetical protein J6V65_02265 [Fibrobacterales bacterium]|nr:hypothetical protein [Fibrobacterales bacterium]